MICKQCGRQLPDNCRFCTGCGAAVEVEPAPQPAAQSTVYTAPQPAAQSTVYTAPQAAIPVMPEDPGASTGKTAFILGLIGLIAGALCSCSCALVGGILPMAASIVAIVLGVLAQNKSAAAGFENKKAKTGMILGIVGVVVIIVFIILNMILGAAMGAAATTSGYGDIYGSYSSFL